MNSEFFKDKGMRIFIALNFPADILEKISSVQDKLPDFKGKKTELKNVHLTLKFLGEVDYEKLNEVKLRLKKIKFEKFKAEINEIGFFDNFYSGIVWLGIKNCGEFQKKIDSVLESLFEKEKRFMGHLTIARTKKIKDKEKFLDDLNEIEIPEMKFSVDKFYLISSVLEKDGPKYEYLEEYELD